jgi:hypothetical protein
LRYAARERADAGVREEDFILDDREFVPAQLLVRKDFRQSHVGKLTQKEKRQSGKTALPFGF